MSSLRSGREVRAVSAAGIAFAFALAVTASGCASTGATAGPGTAPGTHPSNGQDMGKAAAPAAPAGAEAAAPAGPGAAAYASTYKRRPSPPVLIENATLLTAAGPRIENGWLLLRDGKVAGLGAGSPDAAAAAGAQVVDGRGRWVTPGIIDPHSHLGVYPAPEVSANSDGNELTNPVTAEVWAEHSVWPQDPQFPLVLAGGVTTMQILPGSGNLIGGRSITVKNVRAEGVDGMKFPGAPYGLKMACGENPKRVYGDKGRAPSTRMGNVAGYREAWIRAAAYRQHWQDYRERLAKGEAKLPNGQPLEPPDRDLQLETLAGVLDGSILVQNHCYRADEMLEMIDIAKEFGFKISAFHHAVEAYKIAGVLAKNGICADMWADWWGFKMEALDGIRENIALVHQAGACAVVHSDSATGAQRLNQEAAKAMAAGRRAGLNLTAEDAVRWLTINPARSLGIDKQTGSLEVGKMADVVMWSGDPFSVYSRAEKVYIDGALEYDRHDPAHQPVTDFELGLRDHSPIDTPPPPPGTGTGERSALDPAAPLAATTLRDGGVR